MAAHRLLRFLVLLCYYFLLLSSADTEENLEQCPKSFPCGDIGEIHFPLSKMSSQCSLPIWGCDDAVANKEILVGNQTWHQILSVRQGQMYNSFSIYDHDFEHLLSSRDCGVFSYPIIPPNTHVRSFHILNNISFFKCKPDPRNIKLPSKFFKYADCSDYDIYFSHEHDRPSFLDGCPDIQLPVGLLPPTDNDPFKILISSLEIEVSFAQTCSKCYYEKGGQCLLDTENTHCHQAYVEPPDHKDKGRASKVMKIGLAIGCTGGITLALFALVLLYKRRHNSSGYQNPLRSIYSGSHSNTNPESGTVYLGIPVFSYEELQEATNNFDQARELGEGGFGTVYYGNLRDGRQVAVKRLYERNNRPVESFINEIQILTQLRHRNLVSLYGCTSRHSRELLLVYEYIPNGTVGRHLHGDQAKQGLLQWSVRMKIAIETASALTYLHASDIIHRDVKTSNILLDNNFCVKVADFGLSRLFPNNVTHVSTAPQGTPGYLDPEYRQCYQLTSKSDVYSFGVVLVELISSMPAVDMDRDEIKLANLATKKIQRREFSELVDPSLGFQSDNESKRMIISVAELAFQCLQAEKELRPSMDEVLEVLQRIEGGKDEPGNLKEVIVHGARVSHTNAHPSPRTQLDLDEVKLRKNLQPQRLHQSL